MEASARQMRQLLQVLVPEWGAFKIAGCAPYLGTLVGPEACLEDQWAGAVRKWKSRTMETSLTRAPAEASCRI